jgi:hypothetical protein
MVPFNMTGIHTRDTVIKHLNHIILLMMKDNAEYVSGEGVSTDRSDLNENTVRVTLSIDLVFDLHYPEKRPTVTATKPGKVAKTYSSMGPVPPPITEPSEKGSGK